MAEDLSHRFNMMTGRAIAVSLFSVSARPQHLPDSIQHVQTRTRLIQDVDRTIGPHFGSFNLSDHYKGQISSLSQTKFNVMMNDLTKVAAQQIKDVENTNARNGVAFSIWSGCIMAANKISPSTRDGANTPQSRTVNFTYLINPLCRIDELFKAGVETAPILKRLRKEDVEFDGVPAGSPVLMYKDKPYEERSSAVVHPWNR